MLILDILQEETLPDICPRGFGESSRHHLPLHMYNRTMLGRAIGPDRPRANPQI